MPVYINITNGKTGDNKDAYGIPFQKGAVIVADRYCNDFPMLNVWDSKGAFFVIRHKDNLKYEQIKELELPPIGKQHVLIDQQIILSNTQPQKKHPKNLRRVAV